VGEMRLTPVANGLVRGLPWHPGHAIAVSGFYLREPSVRAPLRGEPAEFLPAILLAMQVQVLPWHPGYAQAGSGMYMREPLAIQSLSGRTGSCLHAIRACKQNNAHSLVYHTQWKHPYQCWVTCLSADVGLSWSQSSVKHYFSVKLPHVPTGSSMFLVVHFSLYACCSLVHSWAHAQPVNSQD